MVNLGKHCISTFNRAEAETSFGAVADFETVVSLLPSPKFEPIVFSSLCLFKQALVTAFDSLYLFKQALVADFFIEQDDLWGPSFYVKAQVYQ